MEEIWKPIVGYEGWYSISNFGRIRRDKKCSKVKIGHILRPCKNKGYYQISLLKNKVRRHYEIHSLIANAFIGIRPIGMQVNHKDGNSENNNLLNLEYVTPAQNMKHARDMGKYREENNGRVKFTREQIISMRKEYSCGGIRQIDLVKKYKISKAWLSMILNRKYWISA